MKSTWINKWINRKSELGSVRLQTPRHYKTRFNYFVFGNNFLFEDNDMVRAMYPQYF